MPNPTSQDDKRVLALLWHAPHGTITAGGFRRTYEIFVRTPMDFDIHVVDDSPSFLRGIKNAKVHIAEYEIHGVVRRLENSFFWVEQALEWIMAAIAMLCICARLRLENERFDVIFVPSSKQIPALLAGILARFIFRVPLVACNLNIDIFPASLRRPLARLHNLADVVIVISEHLAGALEGYGVTVPIELNKVGLDTAFISGVPEPETKEYDAVFVGRHDTEKGAFDLIEIWAKVVERRPAASLVMIGSSNPTNRARLNSLMEKLALVDNVVRVGMVDDRRKVQLIKGSKICLFPSYVDEWGIVPQEALACGLPVVAYDLPVYQENIKGCPSVFLEPRGDLEAMAAVASSLLEGDSYLEHAGNGPEYVKRFDWDAVARGEFDILRSAIG